MRERKYWQGSSVVDGGKFWSKREMRDTQYIPKRQEAVQKQSLRKLLSISFIIVILY